MNKNDIVWDTTIGDTFTVTVKVSENGVDANLTGKVLGFYLNVNGVTYTKKTNVGGSGFVITSPTTGLASLTILPNETVNYAVGNHEFAVKLEYSGVVQTLAKGILAIKKNVI
jgi:hypothetical protein